MLIFILKKKGQKRLEVAMRDLYLFSFNTGIVVDTQFLMEENIQIIYSFALSHLFQSIKVVKGIPWFKMAQLHPLDISQTQIFLSLSQDFHSVLNSNFQEQMQIKDINNSYQSFHSKIASLYQQKNLFYQYSTQILNQPIHVKVLLRSKLIIQSWKNLAKFYYLKKSQLTLNQHQAFMKHMHDYYNTILHNLPVFEFIMLDSYQTNKNGNDNNLNLDQQKIQLSSQVLVRHQLQA